MVQKACPSEIVLLILEECQKEKMLILKHNDFFWKNHWIPGALFVDGC